MKEIAQPKFKFGRRVKTKDGKSFVVDSISTIRNPFCYVYLNDDLIEIKEDDLVETVEPLTAEFELLWHEWAPHGPVYPLIVRGGSNVNLEQFRGKRTRVKIEEIV